LFSVRRKDAFSSATGSTRTPALQRRISFAHSAADRVAAWPSIPAGSARRGRQSAREPLHGSLSSAIALRRSAGIRAKNSAELAGERCDEARFPARRAREDDLGIGHEQARVPAGRSARDRTLELAPEVEVRRRHAEGAEPDRQRSEQGAEAGLVDARDDARVGELLVRREGEDPGRR
jgi:hypothetical protein